MVTTATRGRCVLCPEHRPLAKSGPGLKYHTCQVCGRRLDAEAKERRAREDFHRRAKRPIVPDDPMIPRFITWRGHTVGLYSQGSGRYRYYYYPNYSGTDAARLPNRGVLDLNVRCEGYDRQQVKILKRTIAQCYADYYGFPVNGKLPDIRPKD